MSIAIAKSRLKFQFNDIHGVFIYFKSRIYKMKSLENIKLYYSPPDDDFSTAVKMLENQ